MRRTSRESADAAAAAALRCLTGASIANAAAESDASAAGTPPAGALEAFVRSARAVCQAAKVPGAIRSAAQLQAVLRPAPLVIAVTRLLPQQGAALSEWSGPVLRSGAIGATRELLEAALDAWDGLEGRQKCGAAFHDVLVLVSALSTILAGAAQAVGAPLPTTMGSAVRGLAGSGAATTDEATLASAVPPRMRLLKALLADDAATVRAMSRLPGVVQREVWPRARQAATTAAGSGAGGDSIGGLSASRAASWGYSLLGQSAWGALGISRGVHAMASATSSSSSSSSAAGQRLGCQFLAALTRTGLMASLTAALLAGPIATCHDGDGPPPPGPGQQGWCDDRPGLVAVPHCAALRSCMELISNVAKATPAFGCAAALRLDMPEVRQLQREALRQVAAAADQWLPTSGAADQAPPPSPSSLRRWPLLTQQEVSAAFIEPGRPWQLELSYLSSLCVISAVGPIAMASSAGMASAAGMAERLFPCRTEAAALAADVVSALHACVVRTWGVAAVAKDWRLVAAAESEIYAPQIAPGLLASSSLGLVQVVVLRMYGATAEEQEACLPDLLQAAARLAGTTAVAARFEAARNMEGRLATTRQLPAVLGALASILHGVPSQATALPRRLCEVSWCGDPDTLPLLWQQLSPAARARCLQRLLPTELPRCLDELLRAAAARGELQPDLVMSCEVTPPVFTIALAVLLSCLIRNRVKRARLQQLLSGAGRSAAAPSGGDTGDECWVVEDELGLLLTAIKLMRLEVEAVPGQQRQQQQDQQEMLRHRQLQSRGLASFVLEFGLSAVAGLPRLLREG